MYKKLNNFVTMNDLVKFREDANARDLCSQYRGKWDLCKSKKDLIDLALDSNGMPYLCQSIFEKWGLTPEFIATEFADYINGKYISKHESGYTSTLYVLYDGDVEVSSTALVFIGCRSVVNIPKNRICRCYVLDSVLRFEGEGMCEINEYGNCSVDCGFNIKRL